MKVIILAAGIGKRLDIDEEDKPPKCLLKVKNNESVLGLTLKNILLNEIEKIVIVTGFKHALVEEYVLSQHFDNADKFEFVFNPAFNETIIHSVKHGFSNICKEKDRHVLLINGDTLFSKHTFKKAFEICRRNDSSITIFGCVTHDIHQDDVKLLTHNNLIDQVGKNIEIANSVSSGAILFCNAGLDKYLETLESGLINNFRTHHQIIEFIRQTGYKVYFNDNGVRDWLEIDTKENLLFATLSPLLDYSDNF
ncbi:hypothetical protein BCS42_05815 [Crenothrix sp. D3]|nr:hypothetical protein BCS42_05815 [Crenothrix sp. D3]